MNRIFLTQVAFLLSIHALAQIRQINSPLPATILSVYKGSGAALPASFISFKTFDSTKEFTSYFNPFVKLVTTCRLPFFCRQELAVEKHLGIPLRLRLGSLQQTDWLEQKPTAASPH